MQPSSQPSTTPAFGSFSMPASQQTKTTLAFGGFTLPPPASQPPPVPATQQVEKKKDFEFKINFGDFNLKPRIDDLKTILRHNIEEKQKEKFMEMSDISVRPAVKKILDNTVYITYEEFKFKFIQAIRHHTRLLLQSSNKIKRFLVVMDIDIDNKNTNEWLYDLFNNYIKVNYSEVYIIPVSSNLLRSFELIEDEFIVFLGDCIYNGDKIHNYLINLNRTNINSKIYVCLNIPFTSKQGLLNIKNAFNNNKWFIESCSGLVNYKDRTKIYPIQYYLSEDEYNAIQEFYPISYCNFYNRYNIYFDHKIENNKIFPSGFYQGVVPNKKNKDVLNDPNTNPIIPGKTMDVVPIIKGYRNDKIEVREAILLYKPMISSSSMVSLNNKKPVKRGKISVIKKIKK